MMLSRQHRYNERSKRPIALEPSAIIGLLRVRKFPVVEVRDNVEQCSSPSGLL